MKLSQNEKGPFTLENFSVKRGTIGHSKHERMEIIDLHQKCVFAGWYFQKPPPIPQIMAIFC